MLKDLAERKTGAEIAEFLEREIRPLLEPEPSPSVSAGEFSSADWPDSHPWCESLGLRFTRQGCLRAIARGLELGFRKSPADPGAAADKPRLELFLSQIMAWLRRGPPGQTELAADEKQSSRGVSFLDAALVLSDEDRELAREMAHRWQRTRDPKRPASIGICPNHRQVKLYAPDAIFRFVEKVEGPELCAERKLRQRLTAKARAPRRDK